MNVVIIHTKLLKQNSVVVNLNGAVMLNVNYVLNDTKNILVNRLFLLRATNSKLNLINLFHLETIAIKYLSNLVYKYKMMNNSMYLNSH